ncbi:KH domain-containing protein [Candidatus Shapirobacteria bacterium]|nr:KH domain-containing protein [Candidatus Shapirobacteria bacterium]
MKELLEYILKCLVDKKEAVIVEEIPADGFTSLLISADQDDLGKIIGKGGKIIKALRTVVNASAAKKGSKCLLKINEGVGSS